MPQLWPGPVTVQRKMQTTLSLPLTDKIRVTNRGVVLHMHSYEEYLVFEVFSVYQLNLICRSSFRKLNPCVQ